MTPVLKSKNFNYTRFKGIVWSTDGLENPTCVTASACRAICDLVAKEPKKPLVVNCSGIRSFVDHAFDGFSAIIAEGHQVILTNTKGICGQIIQQYPSSIFPRTVFDDDQFIAFGKERPEWAKKGEAIIDESTGIEETFIDDLLKHSYERFAEPRRLASTPFLANGVCDLGKILSQPDRFMWMSLLAAEKFEKFLTSFAAPSSTQTTRLTGELRLLAVSLRASPLAVAVALLSEQKVDIIDHMGPIQRIMEEDRVAGAARRCNYVFVADFLVGGTELKIAKTFAYLRGSVVCHVLTVGSYLPSEGYNAGIQIDALGSLKKSCSELTLQF